MTLSTFARRALSAAPVLVLPLLALQATKEQAKPPVFAAADDARKAVTHALEVAVKKHKRVLLVWGKEAADDVALVETLRGGRTKAWPFYYEYELVGVDAGDAALAASLGVPHLEARPSLTVLDAAGKPLASRAAAEMRGDGGWSADKLGAFLAEHAVEPLDAEDVLKKARERAAAEKRNLLVHFGAPW